jgi:hypothetical protein
MKRVLLVILMAALIMPAFVSCKKGDRDPFLSLKSRKARLVGDWKLKSGSLTQVNGNVTTILNFNGSSVSWTEGSDNGTDVYTEDLKVNKDGTYERNTNNNGTITAEKGLWSFMDANKNEGIKDKEYVVIIKTSETTTYPSGSSTSYAYTGGNGGSNNPYTVKLEKLSSKEMIIVMDESSTSGNSVYRIGGTMTYSK